MKVGEEASGGGRRVGVEAPESGGRRRANEGGGEGGQV
jgi:hypothetical protein